MSEHKHFYRLRFVTFNVHARLKWPDAYWYVFICDDWQCNHKKQIARDRFWNE